MVEQHPNIQRYMRGIQEFNENELDDSVQTLDFSEHIVYRIAGKSCIAGEYHGIEQFTKVLRLVKKLTSGTIAFKPQIVLADDRTVMAYGRATAKRKGKILDIDQVLAIVDAITADDIQRLARELMVADRLRLAVVGPVSEEESLAELLKI